MREGSAETSPGTALRLAAATPKRRRAARILLEEAATAGGWVEESAGQVALVGADAGRVRRLRDLLDRLLGGATLGPWPPVPPELTGLDGWLASLDPLAVARVRQGWRLGTAGESRPAFLRLEVPRGVVAGMLGPLGADPDLLDHAQRRMEAALLPALADPARRRALLGTMRAERLHLSLPDVPRRASPGLVATVKLAEAADPAALAARRAELAAQGCALEVEGLDVAALALVDPAALPADLLRLDWSPALAGMALEGVDPARLVLAGADSPEAQGWARARRVALIEAGQVAA